MTTLPLAWLVSVLTTIAAFSLSQDTRIPFPARFFLCFFLLALATAGLLLGFRLSYDASWAAHIQPLIAVMVAPSAFLGFNSLTQNAPSDWRKTLMLNGIPILVAQVIIVADLPVSADVFVLTITSIYLFRVACLLPCTTDEFVHVAPHALRIVRAALYTTLFLLGLMVVSDSLVVAASILAGDAFILKFLSGLSGAFTAFVFVVALIGFPMLLNVSKGNSTPSEEPTEQDRAMLSALDALMTEKQIFTDSNLTLARVARRLSVPIRDVSSAINRMTGENFSRYINGFRVRHAQSALCKTALPITEVMFDAGFISKSSFNTEFRRIVGQTPSKFRSSKADK